MKKYILIFLLLFLFLIGCSQNPKDGRYQLQWHKGFIIVLDTQTGTIWQKMLGQDTWTKYELSGEKEILPKLDWKSLEKKEPSTLIVPNLFPQKD